TVELSGAAVIANATPDAPKAPTPNDVTPAAPKPDEAAPPVAPDPTPTRASEDAQGEDSDGPEKATGHARVAQNFERHLDRMIARAHKRLGDKAADFSGMFDQMRKVLDAFAADPSMRPSEVMKQIHQIMRDWRHGAPNPAPTPIDPPTPPAPAPEAKPAAPNA